MPETEEAIALVYNKDLVTDKYVPKDLDDVLVKAAAFQKGTRKALVCNQGFGASDAYHAVHLLTSVRDKGRLSGKL